VDDDFFAQGGRHDLVTIREWLEDLLGHEPA
jgi:hypothetical protein